MWRARSQMTRARISNLVSGGQCHLIHLTIRRKFSWHSLAYYVYKGGLKPHSFYFKIRYIDIPLNMFNPLTVGFDYIRFFNY